ncbi:hypothetical protein QJS10_CPA01g02499 [Acorus calamus]|uniref:Uncharacterized protein n=1 Tax=Acorus calamus TaxID=4465 RepID=A0AAV9FHW3_ACOCL|nr:hypothetical protein QJS10_CPA01g02499 [Acorus calamus]
MAPKRATSIPWSSSRSSASLKESPLERPGRMWVDEEAYEHYFTGTKTRVSYANEVTAYVEKFRMKKMTGIKCKQVLLWVPITEMSIDDPKSEKITSRLLWELAGPSPPRHSSPTTKGQMKGMNEGEGTPTAR